jgi:hypothetical protein
MNRELETASNIRNGMTAILISVVAEHGKGDAKGVIPRDIGCLARKSN